MADQANWGPRAQEQPCLDRNAATSMPSPKGVAATVSSVEGFDVRFLSRTGADIAHRRIEDYPFVKAANRTWTVARWRATRFWVVPHRVLEAIVAAMFFVAAALAWRESRAQEIVDEEEAIVAAEASKHGVVLTAFIVIFLAEWGDLTQILTATSRPGTTRRSPSLPGRRWRCGRSRRSLWPAGRRSRR